MKRVALLLALSVLGVAGVGCATTSGTDPKTSRSGFDGATTVEIAPHGAACTSALCLGLGAQWRSTQPQNAILVVELFGGIQALTSARLSIDGEVINLPVVEKFTSFSTRTGAPSSSKAFLIPLPTVRRLAASTSVWLRAGTPTGFIDEAVIDGARDSKAYHAMRRFLAEVDRSQGG